ncbi:MAG: hypothetical protein M3332_19365 [Actinomycetota bacterium]|nr:hypothetical protein [Actinomycetota bacterium]
MTTTIDPISCTIHPIEEFGPPEVIPRTGVEYWDLPFQRAQEAYEQNVDPLRGFTVYFQAREYKFRNRITMMRAMGLLGSGGGVYRQGTILRFDSVQGVIIPLSATRPARTGEHDDQPITGQGTVIERLGVVGPGKSGGTRTTDHGIVVNARCTIRNVGVTSFSGDGIHIRGMAWERPPTNANAWMLEHVMVTECGRHGVFVYGSDVNAGCAIGVDTHKVDGWGIRDESQLGCTWLGCHVDQHEAPVPSSSLPIDYMEDGAGADGRHSVGSYFCKCPLSGVAGASVFVGCYVEGEQTVADRTSPNRVFISPAAMTIGGNLSTGTPGGGGALGMSGYVLNAVNGIWARGKSRTTGPDDVKSAIQVGGGAVLTIWPGARDVTPSYSLEYSRLQRGWWSLVWANLDYPGPLAFSDDTALQGHRQVWAPQGLQLGLRGGNPAIYVTSDYSILTDGQRRNAGDRWEDPNPWRNPPHPSYVGKVCVRPGVAAPPWDPSTSYDLGAVIVPTTDNGLYYMCSATGPTYTRGNEPSLWPEIPGDIVTESGGTLQWTCGISNLVAPVWESGATKYLGDRVIKPGGEYVYQVVEVTGRSQTGGTLPNFDSLGAFGQEIRDGDVTWRMHIFRSQAALFKNYGAIAP